MSKKEDMWTRIFGKPTRKIVPVESKIIEEPTGPVEVPIITAEPENVSETTKLMTDDAEELFNKVLREIGYGIVSKAHDLALSEQKQIVDKEDLKKVLVQLGYISSS